MKDDFEVKYEFDVRLDDGAVTLPMKVESWAKRQTGVVRVIALAILVPLIKHWWVELKTAKTMKSVDAQAESLVELWETQEDEKDNGVVTIIEDPSSPLGFSEMSIKSSHTKT